MQNTVRMGPWIALSLVVAACSADGSGPGDVSASGAAPSAGPLADCVVGLWQDPAPGDCYCPGRRECAAGDCQGLRVVALNEDGTYYTGYAAVSPSTQTLSVVGKLNRGVYSVTEDSVRFEPSAGHAYDSPATCDGDRLVLNHMKKVRAPRWFAAALSGAAGEPTGPSAR